FSDLKTLELWYQALAVDDLIAALPAKLRARSLKRMKKEQTKSRGEELFPKLVDHRGEVPVIKDQLPTIFHTDLLPPGDVTAHVREAWTSYRASLPPAYRALLDRFEIRDAAVKVVCV